MVSMVQGGSASRAASSAATHDAYQDAWDEHASAKDRFTIGMVVGGGGALLVGTGLAVNLSGPVVAPAWFGDGAGLTVGFRR